MSLSKASAANMGGNNYLHPPHCQSPSSPEAEFLGVIGTKVLRFFLLAIHSLALTIMKSRKLHSLVYGRAKILVLKSLTYVRHLIQILKRFRLGTN